MGNSRYSAEDRKANQDAHEARMAQFEKSEAGARERREQSGAKPVKPESEPDTDDQRRRDHSGADQPDQ